MKKIVLTFGLIAGVIVVAMMFITMPFVMEGSMEHSELLGYTTMVIALSTIFIAVKNYRDKHLAGTIKFGKAFLVGLYITLIAGVMYAAGWEVYMQLSGTDMQEFFKSYMNSEIKNMENAGASIEKINSMVEESKAWMEMMKNPVVRFIAVMFMEIVPVGLIISLISADLLKKKNVSPVNANN